MSLTLKLKCPERRDVQLDFLPNCERVLADGGSGRPGVFERSDDGHHRIHGLFDCGMRVRDTDSFRIERGDGGMALSQRIDIPLARDGAAEVRPYGGTLVMLLESPHRHEFHEVGGAIEPRFPAMGTTGNNLSRRLVDVIRSAPDLETSVADQLPVRVVLCNPIQFQASLHFAGADRLCKKCRTLLKIMVWCAIWNVEPVRDDFLQRVKRAEPNWILNACVLEGGLNWEVSSFLANNHVEAEIRRTAHPVGWRAGWQPWCERVCG